MATRMTQPAPCHPDRPLMAHGLCQPCYRAWRNLEFPYMGYSVLRWHSELKPHIQERWPLSSILSKTDRLPILAKNCVQPLTVSYEPWQRLADHMGFHLRDVVAAPVLKLWADVCRADARAAQAALAKPAPDVTRTKTLTLENQVKRAEHSVESAERIWVNAQRRLEAAEDALQEAEARRAKAQDALDELQAALEARRAELLAAAEPTLEAFHTAQAAAQAALEEALESLRVLGAPLDPNAPAEGTPGPSRAARAFPPGGAAAGPEDLVEIAPTSDHLSEGIDTEDLARSS